jgi:N-ethylmaleimide reductase
LDNGVLLSNAAARLDMMNPGLPQWAIPGRISKKGGIVKLLTSYQLGTMTLPNRLVMAPMTRSRAGEGNVPTELNALYYVQRATAGLIITEATQVSTQGIGYPWTPGIHTAEQVDGWKQVVNAIHDAGGRVVLQLFHCGRISHPDFHDGELPVAPSAVKPQGQVFTPQGMKDFVTPRALRIDEIPGIIAQFVQGTKNALAAGFDGVEIHAANGYLPNQFLCDGTNKRTDAYGGSVENRCRFVLELTEAVCAASSSGNVGIRLSPSGIFNDMTHSEPVETFDFLVDRLNDFNLLYLHVMEPMMPVDHLPQYLTSVTEHYRKRYAGTMITNANYDRDSGKLAIENGVSDLVAYGKLFLSNPDLPKRFERHAPLNAWDEDTFYGGDEKGYTDYPFLDA